jgi:hypothetical protein
MRATRQIGLREGAEGVLAAAATAGIAKVAGVVGEKIKEKLDGQKQEQPSEDATSRT